MVANAFNIDEIKAAIIGLYSLWKSNHTLPNPIDTHIFERRELTRQLADLLGAPLPAGHIGLPSPCAKS